MTGWLTGSLGVLLHHDGRLPDCTLACSVRNSVRLLLRLQHLHPEEIQSGAVTGRTGYPLLDPVSQSMNSQSTRAILCACTLVMSESSCGSASLVAVDEVSVDRNHSSRFVISFHCCLSFCFPNGTQSYTSFIY